ncbi:MAG: hypothetical protein WCP19_11655 [Chloroflexota bacterium]
MITNILSSLETLPYFTIESVRQLMGDEPAAEGTIQTGLYRWMKAGLILQLKKGMYMPRRFYDLHRGDEDFAPAVSSILIPQSYLSLEFVLQRNSILTDVTYPVSAVTIKQTRVFENTLGTFTYRSLKPCLYSGFSITEYMGIQIGFARKAKALFDFLYFRPSTSMGLSDGYHLAEDLRLNLDDFETQERVEFAGYITLSKSPKMEHILENLEKTVWRP